MKVPIQGGHKMIEASSFSLAITNSVKFDILIDSDAHDEISEAIAKHTYAFPNAFQLLPDLIPVNSKVLDLGAHIGTFSLFAAALGHTLLAVEASPDNSVLLEASVSRNRFDNLTVVSVAVSNRPAMLEFIQAGPYGFVANPSQRTPAISVPGVTVDELLASLNWRNVDIIKMDIEGSEVAAIEGMANLLSAPKAPMILYESNGHTLNFFGETPNSLMAALEAFGFRCYLIQANQLIPVQSSELQPECNVDCLAAKQLPGHASWPIRSPLTKPEVIEKIITTCSYPGNGIRAYVGRALARPEAAYLLDNPHIREVLETLKRDPKVEVQEAAAWYDSRSVVDNDAPHY